MFTRFPSKKFFQFLTYLLVFSAFSRCAYLGLGPTPEERLQQQAIEAQERRQQEIQYGLEERQVVAGMRMADVQAVLGRPADVENAGDPSSGNQKWVYYNGLSSPWSMKSSRVIYFEHGVVAGWETANGN